MDRSPPPPPLPPATPPPQPPKESLARGYKFMWRILLISNLALGAYIFTRPRKKESIKKDKKEKKPTKIQSAPEISVTPNSEGAATNPAYEHETRPTPIPSEGAAINPAYEPETRPTPIPENQWSKPFKW